MDEQQLADWVRQALTFLVRGPRGFSMAHVVLFHSILGLRQAEREIASVFEADGHEVSLPDLFAGRTAKTYEDGFALKEVIGDGLIEARARRALDDSPETAVLAGVSFGAFLVGQLWGSRPKMQGALLFAGIAPWMEHPRPGLPVQAHIAQPDPFDDEAFFEDWVAEAGETSCEVHRYPGVGHYFLDRSLPDYDAAAAELTLERSREFLEGL